MSRHAMIGRVVTTATALAALACVVALLGHDPASASFPGQNGLIAYQTDTCEIQGGEPSEGDCLGSRIAIAHPRRPKRQRILPCEESPCLASNPRWSPDGKRLLYDTGGQQIYMSHRDGSRDRPLAEAERFSSVQVPAWSPNSKRFVFTRDVNLRGEYEPRMFVKRLSGGPEKRVTRGYGSDPDWSSRNVIVFTRYLGDFRFPDAFVVRPNGRGLRRLTYRGTGFEPSWSPNGRMLVVARLVKGQPNIAVIDRRGRLRRVLTRRGGRAPVWSPDGKRIAFVRNFDVYSVSARGGDLRRLLPRDVDTEEIDWQPRPRRRDG